jgi:hypothetical protein
MTKLSKTQSALHFSDEVLERELGRFFEAADFYGGVTGDEAKMPTCIVDDYWHRLIEDSIGYHNLVVRWLGTGVRVEHVKRGGVDVISWIPFYEELTGDKLHDAWFTRRDGSFLEETKRAYLAGEYFRMSWDCTPGIVHGDFVVNLA